MNKIWGGDRERIILDLLWEHTAVLILKEHAPRSKGLRCEKRNHKEKTSLGEGEDKDGSGTKVQMKRRTDDLTSIVGENREEENPR